MSLHKTAFRRISKIFTTKHKKYPPPAIKIPQTTGKIFVFIPSITHIEIRTHIQLRQDSPNSAILPIKNRYFVIEKSNLQKTPHARAIYVSVKHHRIVSFFAHITKVPFDNYKYLTTKSTIGLLSSSPCG